MFALRLNKEFSRSVQHAIEDTAKEMGYERPKAEEVEVVENFVAGWDVFLLLPIGGRKSFVMPLCHWCSTLFAECMAYQLLLSYHCLLH